MTSTINNSTTNNNQSIFNADKVNRIALELLSLGDFSGATKVLIEQAKEHPKESHKLLSINCELQLDKLKTQNIDFEKVKSKVRVLCKLDYPVLISGPTGTGKEHLAHALHGDRQGKFVCINCAGLPEYLIESELFGHRKGSFTGASDEHIGLFRHADGGSLLLDEIGELSAPLQAKLLRVLQDGKVRAVGSLEHVAVEVRFICATKRDLAAMVKEGKFREDLYHRINSFELKTTSLMSRGLDEVRLISAYLINCATKEHPDKLNGGLVTLTEEFMKQIEPYITIVDTDLLEGNVRSLQSLVNRFIIFGEID